MTVCIEKWLGGYKIEETKAVSSVTEARRQLQQIKNSSQYGNILIDTPNRFSYSTPDNKVIEYRIVKYFTKQPL